jgi:transposase
MAREVGYAPIGTRLFDKKPMARFLNYSVIGALSLTGLHDLMIIEGSVTTDVFVAYAENILKASVYPGQVVVLDNCSVHKTKCVTEWFQDHGCHLLYTPPYSPEWNPIEWAWSKVKTGIRRQRASSFEKLQDALALSASSVTTQDAQNMIAACGYLRSNIFQ